MKNSIRTSSLLNSLRFFNNSNIVSYEFSVREIPENWNFLIMMGVRHIVNQILNFKISKKVLKQLNETIGVRYNISDAYLDFLKDFEFSGSLSSIPNGEIVFPGEPLLRITGRPSEIELVKDFVTSTLSRNISTLSYYVQFFLSNPNIRFVDNGINDLVSKLCYIAGFWYTTNLDAYSKYKIPLVNDREFFSHMLDKDSTNPVKILDSYNIEKTLGKLDKNCTAKIRHYNIQANMYRIRKNPFVKEIFVSCPSDLNILSTIVRENPDRIYVDTKEQNMIDLECYPVFNHTKEEELISLASGQGTLPGIKHIYHDQRDEWTHLISLNELCIDGLDSLFEDYIKDGVLLQEGTDIVATRSICNGSLVSIPAELLNKTPVRPHPITLHRSIIDKYYEIYGELND